MAAHYDDNKRLSTGMTEAIKLVYSKNMIKREIKIDQGLSCILADMNLWIGWRQITKQGEKLEKM